MGQLSQNEGPSAHSGKLAEDHRRQVVRLVLHQAWALFRRELAASRPSLLAVVGLIVIWKLVLGTLVGEMNGVLASLASLYAVPLWLLITSLRGWWREWSGGSIHYTLAFPAPGWLLVATKAVAAVFETSVVGLTVGAGGWILYTQWFRGGLFAWSGGFIRLLIDGHGSPDRAAFWRHALVSDGIKVVLVVGVYLFAANAIIQLAYLAGRAATGARPAAGLISPLVGAAAAWLLFGGLGVLLGRALGWLPQVTYHTAGRLGKLYHFPHQASPGPTIAVALIAVAYFAFAAWLAEQRVDV